MDRDDPQYLDRIWESALARAGVTPPLREELTHRLGLLAFNLTFADQLGPVAENLATVALSHLRLRKRRQWLNPRVAAVDQVVAARLWPLAIQLAVLIETANHIGFATPLWQAYFGARWAQAHGLDSRLLRRMVSTPSFRPAWAAWAARDGELRGRLTCWLTQTPYHRERARAAIALGWIGDRRAVAALREAGVDTHSFVRLCAVTALGELHDLQAVDALLGAVRDPNINVWRAAVTALARLGPGVPEAPLPESLNGPLVRALRDPLPRVRRAAAEALGQLQYWPALGRVLPLLEDSDFEVQTSAARALLAFGEPGAQQVVELFARPAPLPEVRAQAAVALTRVLRRQVTSPVHLAQTPELDATLHRAIENARQAGSWQAVTAIEGKIAAGARARRRAILERFGPGFAAALLAGMQDPGWRVRLLAAEGLADLGSPQARAALEAAARDTDPVIRRHAAFLLGEITGTD